MGGIRAPSTSGGGGDSSIAIAAASAAQNIANQALTAANEAKADALTDDATQTFDATAGDTLALLPAKNTAVFMINTQGATITRTETIDGVAEDFCEITIPNPVEGQIVDVYQRGDVNLFINCAVVGDTAPPLGVPVKASTDGETRAVRFYCDDDGAWLVMPLGSSISLTASSTTSPGSADTPDPSTMKFKA